MFMHGGSLNRQTKHKSHNVIIAKYLDMEACSASSKKTNDRTTSKGGGVAVIIKKNAPQMLLPIVNTNFIKNIDIKLFIMRVVAGSVYFLRIF